MPGASDLVTEALRTPERTLEFTLGEWNVFVRQARIAGVLARISLRIAELGLADRLPDPVRPHVDSALIVAEKQIRDVRWEIHCIREALATEGLPLILLKGAAYVAAGLPAARGRVFGDTDILAPKAEIGTAERALRRAGWFGEEMDDYDERYYRTWMHQIPPMHHFHRRTVIDVHHTIVPETARADINRQSLREEAVPIDGLNGVSVLAPTDMVVHTAAHLFNEGEFNHGLRDLSDLNALLRHFGTDPGFWPGLVERARSFGLHRPLSYALRFTHRLLGTPVPAPTLAESARDGPGAALAPLMTALFTRALRPQHVSCRDALTPPGPVDAVCAGPPPADAGTSAGAASGAQGREAKNAEEGGTDVAGYPASASSSSSAGSSTAGIA